MNKIGILDPEGKNKNPFTEKSYSEKYYELAKMWTSLPVYQDRIKIIDSIQKNQVLLIISGTGSGKSVLVPKFALHALSYQKLVVITNPKIPATIENAKFAADTMDVELGSYVGYQYKGAVPESKSEKTKLLFSTDGAVVSQLLKDPSGKKFGCIIVDEAHERAVQIDFLLFLLKKAITLNNDLKVIIMSATINKEVFSKYFKKTSKFEEFTISGQPNFPIKEYFLKDPSSDVIKSGIAIIKKIISDKPKGDIIFFVNSGNMGKQGCMQLSQNVENKMGLFCTVLSSGLTMDEQEIVISEIKYKNINSDYKVKIVMSTNIGESSITINNLYYVIESGYQLEDSFDPLTNSRQLLLSRISKAQAKQRRGRAGRTQPGEAYNLYTANEYESFDDYPKVSIEKSDITDFILKLYNIENINKNKIDKMLQEMITVPKKEYVDFSFNILNFMNIVENDTITMIGKIVNKLNFDIKQAVSLIYSHFYKCSNMMCYILAIIQISNNQFTTFLIQDKMDDFKIKKQKISNFYHKFGDIFTILKIFKQFKNQENKESWCLENYLNFSKFEKIYEIKKKIKSNYKKLFSEIDDLNIIVESFKSRKQNIIACLTEGYKTNIANYIENTKMYENDFPQIKTKAEIDRDSSLIYFPKKIFYLELANILGRKKYNMCTVISI